MANIYVDSHATGTATGASWTNACTTLAAGITASAAGDDIWVRSNHAETQGSAITLTFKGTAASPNRVICATNANSPPTAADLATTATVTTTGAFGMTVNGVAYIYGITFNNGTGTTAANSTWASTGSANLFLDSCAITHPVTVANGTMTVGSTAATTARMEMKNTPVSFSGGSASGIGFSGGVFKWTNTASAVGGASAATISSLFNQAIAKPGFIYLEGLDLSSLGAAKKIFNGFSYSGVYAQIVNCRTTSGITITPVPTASDCGVDVIVSDSGATGYRQERYRYQATLTTETTIVATATDGTTPISWKVASTANAKRYLPFECLQIVQWVDTTGGALNATISCVTDTNTDATALTNADIWVDAQVLDNGSFPISGLYTSAPATQLTAGSTLTSGTWATTTGMTTPDKRQMTVTFTPGIKGYVRFIVKVARASLTTLRIDPAVTIGP